MLDNKRISELKDEIGEEDFAEVLEMFLGEMTDQLGKFDMNATPERVQASLHALKGAALNVGFQAFADLCATAETFANEGLVQETLAQELNDTFKQSKILINETA